MKREYGRGLDWYNAQFKEQNGGCAVCWDGPGTRRLNIDHDHAWKKVKIEAIKVGFGIWSAKGAYNGELYTAAGGTKSSAIRQLKEKLLSASVRGLLCHRCNRALVLFRDDEEYLEAAAEYLRRFRSRPLTGRGVL